MSGFLGPYFSPFNGADMDDEMRELDTKLRHLHATINDAAAQEWSNYYAEIRRESVIVYTLIAVCLATAVTFLGILVWCA